MIRKTYDQTFFIVSECIQEKCFYDLIHEVCDKVETKVDILTNWLVCYKIEEL